MRSNAAGCQIRNLPALRITPRLPCHSWSQLTGLGSLPVFANYVRPYGIFFSDFIQISVFNLMFYAQSGRAPPTDWHTLDGLDLMKLWCVEVVNWNAQPKLYFNILTLCLLTSWYQSAIFLPSQCPQFVLNCLRFLPDCRPFAQGGRGGGLWLYKIPFLFSAGRLNLIFGLWLFVSTVLTVNSNTWLLISYLRSGTDMSTTRWSWAI